MNRASSLLSILSFCLAHGLPANRTSTNYSIGPETFAGLAGDSNSSAYAQFSAVEPLSGLSIKNMPDLKNFAGFIGQLPPLDQDGDGLPDSQEAVLGTDKTLVDTDGDGLTDGEEVSLGTNPLIMDSDGDGYSDFTEAQASTNPLLASSNPNQAPSLIDLNYSAVLENQPPQTVVGRLTATDPDGNSSLSLSLVSKGDGSLFLIDQQDNLITASIFDYESPKKSFSVTVRASDDKNASLEKTFVIQLLNQVEDLDGDGVEDQVDPDRDGDGFSNADELAYGSDPSDPNSVANQAPTGLSLSSDTISENLPAGTVIGVVQAQDADANDTLTYQLVSPPGQTNNPSASPFTLETNGTLLSSLSFDFEEKDQFPIWVRAMDSHGSIVQKDFVIRVLDVNESTPTLSSPETPSDTNQSEPITPDPDDQNQSTEPQGYWPEGVVKNASINEQNVRHIYLAMLAREPDSVASAYWTQSGQLTNSLVGILAESQEFKIRLANGLVNQPVEPSSDNNQSLPITPDPDDQNESSSGEHLAEIISTEVYAEVSASESLFIGVLTESGEMGIHIDSLSIFKIIDFSGSEVATSNPILSQKDEIINRIQTTLSSGAYTLWVSGDGSTKKPTSIKLTKTAGSAGKFKLFQTRAFSTTSTPLTQNIEIAGNGTAKIFAYAQGTQNLQNLGVTNSINDPELQVFSKPVSGGYWTQTASNDNWADSPQASDLQSMSTFNLQSKESGVIANLSKNAHSFQVRDKSDNQSGVAMLSIEFLESSAEQVEDIITDPDPTPSPPADINETGDTDSELVDHNTTTPTVPKIPGDENPIIDPGSELVDNDQPNPDPSDPIDQNQSTEPDGYWPEGVAKNVPLNEQNVRRIYLAMLGREPDSAGLAYWSQSGQSTNSFVSTLAESQEFKYRLANGLVNQPNEHEESSSSENNQSAPTTPDPVDQNQSTELDGYWPEGVAKNVPLNEQNVRRIYLAMLGREPDSAGLAYWSQSGQSTNYFVDSIAGSAEFQYRLANANNDDPDTPISNPADNMVHPQPPLGVPSAPTDGNETVNADHNTTTPTTPEIPVDDKPITDPESELVDHDPGAPNPADPVDQNQSSEPDGYWPEGVAKNAPLNEQNVRRIYLTMLGREPDSGGLAYWSQSGELTNFFVNSIAGSGEFQYRLANGLVDQPAVPSSENNQSESVAPVPIDQNQSTEPVQPEPEPFPQVPTFELVENQVSENSPTGSLAGKLLVPDHNGTQTLSFVLSEPSPFELKPNGTLLTKRSFDFESDSGSLPLTITAINDGNQSLELSFTVTLLNVIEDLDGDGFEDAHDPDIDGDGLSNKDEALAGTDPTIEDSDEDELSDGEEIALKTNPLSEDSDQDGLTDGTEIGIGTNPLAKDSDGDGFNDQEEVLAGSFPEDANDYPGQQVVVERDPNEGPDGLLYQLSEKKFTLEEAKTHAVEQNAVIPYLAMTDPNTPNDSIGKFLVQFMIRNSTDARPRAWILGENIELYGLIGRAILTQKGPKIAFTGNKKLPVLLGYEKPAVRIPYLITHLPETNGTKVLAKGEMMDDGGEKPFRAGFRISEEILVKTNDPTARIISATLEGNVLEAVVERLEPGTTYYLRTFAENSAGVAYGAFKRIKLTESYNAPFAGKAEGQGWFRSDWFGLFLPANQNWVFHQDFEWIYHGATNQNGIWFWSERIGWSWTREDVWPYLWMNNQSNWTYYFGKKGGQPTFWDYSNQSVFRWRNPVSLVGSKDSIPQ